MQGAVKGNTLGDTEGLGVCDGVVEEEAVQLEDPLDDGVNDAEGVPLGLELDEPDRLAVVDAVAELLIDPVELALDNPVVLALGVPVTLVLAVLVTLELGVPVVLPLGVAVTL